MKAFLVVLLLLSPFAAMAATPEESYLAARDAAIARFKPAAEAGKTDGAVEKAEEAARTDLERRLRPIVGAVEIKGFAKPPTLNPETLFSGDLGFGMLDGLRYVSDDDKISVIVTTEALLKAWLVVHRAWWNEGNVPQSVDAALRSGAFYTQALSTDAAVMPYASLPIEKPAGASLAVAMLDGRAQDIGPQVPDEIIVALLQGGHVFIAYGATATKVAPIAACEAVWKAGELRSTDAYAADQKSGAKDEMAADQPTRVREQADADFHRCYAERAKKQPGFAALVKEAQALADRLAH